MLLLVELALTERDYKNAGVSIFYFFCRWEPEGGILPYKRLGMCLWMGSHFHNWIDYNGVAFSIELLEWGLTFSDFFSYLRLGNVAECLYCG